MSCGLLFGKRWDVHPFVCWGDDSVTPHPRLRGGVELASWSRSKASSLAQTDRAELALVTVAEALEGLRGRRVTDMKGMTYI